LSPRIAIVGSCITRDLWPSLTSGGDHLLYVSRTSFPSLFSSPVQGFTPDAGLPGDLRRHEHNALLADLRKTSLERLVAFRPSHLIVDFIDERFDLLSLGSTLATMSAELTRSGYLAQPAFRQSRRIPRLSAACERLWLDGAAEFAAFVRATPLRTAKLILHSARWATHQRAPDGALSPIRDVAITAGHHVEIAPYNDLLARQEAAFLQLMPPMAQVGAEAHLVADPAHRWGLSPFHYVPEYYAEVRRQLEALGLTGAFSDRLAEPSAPAA
jgi:hypothetical protein